ncbi:MAG: phospho-N-acetylmuramoyl-pentapeptide-transferase [Oscillospiraceae bacterium]|nr:phospho-N-acetylmuramoyl-pentapeptide-transferase [Oscillospiraceae bacterium]
MWVTIIAAAVAFIIAAIVGRFLIPALQNLNARQTIKTDGPTWHMSKQGTPTLGGLIFISGVLVASVLLGLPQIIQGDFSSLFVLVFSLVFGAIGFIDDWAKIKKHENTGLTAVQKFLLQLVAALLFTLLLYLTGHLSSDLYIPFFNTYVHIPWVIYLIFAAFVMVGCVNAVNITDGVDGLAAGVTLPVALFFAVVCALWGETAVGTFSGALFGGLIGFLIYNIHPAKVFMGDTGSLFLGGAVCGLAFVLDMPLILIPVGIIYIVETLSDVIQVVYFRLSHGKRIFRMAPLHHHLELCGWSENKLVIVFTGITLIFCILAFVGVIQR